MAAPAPEDILDRLALQCSVLENRGYEEITPTTNLRRDLLIDEGDRETLADQIEREFEIELEPEDVDQWKLMRDVVRSIREKLGGGDDEGSSYDQVKPPVADDILGPRRRRGRPPRTPN